MITVDVNNVVTEALIRITLMLIVSLKSQTPTKRFPSKGQTPSIQTLVKLLPKSSAIPRQMHLDQRSMHPGTLTKVSPLVFRGLDATFAIKPTTLQIHVQAKAKSKPALRLRSIKTKDSWRFGKAHSPTQNKNNVLLVSSNHGETIYAQHVWASYRLITDVILTT
jgi:hypothetical protein